MKYYEFLLTDEKNGIDYDSYKERKLLIDEFSVLPVDFFSKLRHFQPQIGCLNACKICSKHASVRTEYWNEKRIRNVVAALKYSATNKYRKEKPYIVWDRNEHRSGVIFSYLDNDVGNYCYLKKFVDIVYKELGVKTRISTVGYSRHDKNISQMHKNLSEYSSQKLAGVRLSFTPYALGWYGDECMFSRDDYIKDMADFLKSYKSYFDQNGSGSRQMCVEIRYKPLVETGEVYEFNVLNHMVISTANYLYISKDENPKFVESKIANPYNHFIELTGSPHVFYQFDLYSCPNSVEELKRISHKFIINNICNNSDIIKKVDVYMLANYDGKYYAIDPSISEKGNYGINIYPKTEGRKVSGYIITERFFLNALFEYKKKQNINFDGTFESASWEDVYNVLKICKYNAEIYLQANKKEKYNYILNEVIPMINAYIISLQTAGYTAAHFFDPDFTIDTGIICNMGRALSEFKGITYKENEPLTPTHERNYGSFNSTMTKENMAWRLSCDYDDSIIIEKLNLSRTSDVDGQTVFMKKIKLDTSNEVLDIKKLKESYLIPGQRSKN